MKIILPSFVATFALVLSVQSADVTVKLSKVHLCCQGCVNGAKKAVADINHITCAADQKDSTVTLTGPDNATVQKAADALVKAGYFGVSSDAAIKLSDNSGAKGAKVQSMEISGVHLCCPKCVTAVDKAVKSVEGVKGHTADKNVKSFTVTGEFNDQDVLVALQKAGLAGKIVK